ncbi:MAG: hypothetical protein C0505_06930 [Leptothrix sp. (in: Bacteria)]|nr:hypothetical protein [Leptothrix sp. (in: b-proteobacteria)]
MKHSCGVLAAAVLATCTGLVRAEGVEIHGFAYQNYLRSTSLPYKEAGPNRDSFEEAAVALLFAAPLGERIKSWTQLHMTGEQVRLDWAFVDYRFSASTIGRVGRIKLPIGVYNEIIDAKFLQVAAEAPLLYQQPLGITPESFNGISVNLEYDVGLGMAGFDLYAGQTLEPEEGSSLTPSRLIGGRVTLQTRVPGLRLMASAYSNKFVDTAIPSTLDSVTRNTWVLSTDYKSDRLDLKSEYGVSRAGGRKTKAWYVQGGYTVAENWQPYARFDNLVTDSANSADPSYYQKSVVVGLNYTINSNVSVRAERHMNRGYGVPVASETVHAGEGKPRWSFFTASVNFIF